MKSLARSAALVAPYLCALAGSAVAQNLTFVPTADATADEGSANQNFAGGELKVNFHHSASGTRVDRAFLRFDVRGLGSTPVDCLTLRLTEGQDASNSNTNFEVRLVQAPWTEGSLTWANQPITGRAVGAYLGDPLGSGETIDIALDPSFLSGDGIYDLALIEDKNGGFNGTSFFSREDSASPKLLIGCNGVRAHTAFFVLQTERPVPYSVTFRDLSVGNATAWSWDFGDGSSSTQRNPTHTYATPDSYTVTLTTSGPAGSQTTTRTDYVLAHPADRGLGSVLAWDKVSQTSGGNVPQLDHQDMFARGIASIGDVDGDGVIDIVVGAVGDDDGASQAGAAYVLFMNADATVKNWTKISALAGGFPFQLDANDGFGRVVAGIGDLNQDGVRDIAIGANRDDDGGNDRGAVYILYLNSDGTVKAGQKISSSSGNFTADLDNNDEFGRGIACLNDLDGDGVFDLAVGATGDDDGNSSNGAVYILFMRSDGTVKSHQKLSDTQGGLSNPFFPGLWFGMSVAALGDVDGDGLCDLAVGGNQDDTGGESSGAAWVILLNANGTAKSDHVITASRGVVWGEIFMDDEFGAAIGGPGDIDGDGVPDLVVGSIRDNDNHPGNTALFIDRGAVFVFFLNADGTVRDYQKISDTRGNFDAHINNHDRFGEALGSAGDFNGDGTPDILVGARFDDDGGPNRGAFYFLYLNGSDVIPTVPAADFSGGPTSGPAPLDVSFTDQSRGTVSAWSYDFGDGSTATVQHPNHTYSLPGTYTVALTATGPLGSDTQTVVDMIDVTGTPPPVAAFDANPTAGVTPLTVDFTDLSGGTIESWSWDFGDGASSTLAQPTHTYTAAGLYSVALTVTGPGGSDTAATSDLIDVGEDTPPTAGFDAANPQGPPPLTVAFTDTSTGAIDTWSWDFGDGANSNERDPVYEYTTPGTYSVSLTITGPLGSDTLIQPDLVHVEDDPNVVPYGCISTPGSLSVLSGGPVLGTTMVFGVHNPFGTQAAGTSTRLFFSFNPDPAFPCGTVVPFRGMDGGDGEFLISLVAPDPIRRVTGPAWNGVDPAPISFDFPLLPQLAGRKLHAQAMMIDPTPGAPLPRTMTDALVLTLGL